MDQALTEHHLDWIDDVLRPLCSVDGLRAIVLNSLTADASGDGYRNRTIIVSP